MHVLDVCEFLLLNNLILHGITENFRVKAKQPIKIELRYKVYSLIFMSVYKLLLKYKYIVQ